MARLFDAQAMSLFDLLRSRRRFHLPPSQRVYDWREDKLAQLFHDIGLREGSQLVGPSGSTLFLGTIYLADKEPGSPPLIADGQQRAVTATMLAAGLRDLETDSDVKAQMQALVSAGPDDTASNDRIRMREVDAEFFRQWVQAPGAMVATYNSGDEEGAARSQSQINIINNRNLIVQHLRLLGSDGRRRLIRILEEETVVVVIVTARLEHALDAYTSTYKRGLRQAEVDRLRAELFADSRDEQDMKLANHWDECEATLDKDGLETLCQLLVLIEKGVSPSGDLQSALFQCFSLPQQAQSFVMDSLVPMTAAYQDLCNIDDGLPASRTSRIFKSGRLRRIDGHLITLMRVSHVEWRAPGMLAVRMFRDDLVSLERILSGLERLANAFMIDGVDPHAMGQRYHALGKAILARDWAQIDEAMVVGGELRSRCRNNLSAANFAQKIRFRTPVLLKANDLIAGQVVKIDPASVTCEHILPVSVDRRAPYWLQRFRSADGRRYVGHLHRHKLGNVTLLSHASNREAGNKDFPTKRPILATSGIALSEVVASETDWSMESVEKRTEALATLICQHWTLS